MTNPSTSLLQMQIKKIHFVGIGGAGMGGIAEVLFNEGYEVSGSDLSENAMTLRLKSLNLPVFLGHDACQLQNVDVVVRSSAIPDTNPEIIAAKSANIPIIPRAQMLGELMRFRQGIAVAGTHGKTTTTSLVTSLLAEGGLDPTFVIGGLLNSTGSNARLGASPYLVAEADESDASFLYLHPEIAVVTNIDADHMSTYNNDFNKLKTTFIEFLQHLPFYGVAVLCYEDATIREIIPQLDRPILTYGFDKNADVQAYDIKTNGFSTSFKVRQGQREPLNITLNLPGRHNVLNALAAITVALEVGIDTRAIQKALLNFSGVGRRLQRHGDIKLSATKQVLLIDDYGHHPREISATLEAIRQAWPKRRIVMVYQPHRYTRTRDLFQDFVKVLASVDALLLLDVYSAGEEIITGADSPTLCQHIATQAVTSPTYIPNTPELIKTLPAILQADDILLLQGAGNIGALALQLPGLLQA